jgi:quinol monooxygenase YgiN
LSFHFIVRFEPLPGKETRFRDELLRVNEPSRAEIGCLSIDVFESLREPSVFAIHSEWADEASFELHAISRRSGDAADAPSARAQVASCRWWCGRGSRVTTFLH